MAGHSKWHSIRHKKAANDVARGKVLTKHSKILMVIGRNDPCPDTNTPLKNAIANAKSDGVPKVNIEKILKKLEGGQDYGVIYSEQVYEGFAPGGIPVIITSLTDNTNRSFTDIRTAVMRNGGTLGSPGSVMFLFDHIGVIEVETGDLSEDDLLELAMDGGADDIEYHEDVSLVFTSFKNLGVVRDFFSTKLSILKSVPIYKSKESSQLQNSADFEALNKFLVAVNEVEDTDDIYIDFEYSGE